MTQSKIIVGDIFMTVQEVAGLKKGTENQKNFVTTDFCFVAAGEPLLCVDKLNSPSPVELEVYASRYVFLRIETNEMFVLTDGILARKALGLPWSHL